MEAGVLEGASAAWMGKTPRSIQPRQAPRISAAARRGRGLRRLRRPRRALEAGVAESRSIRCPVYIRSTFFLVLGTAMVQQKF